MLPARAADVAGSKSKMVIENFEPVGVEGRADSSVEEGLPCLLSIVEVSWGPGLVISDILHLA